MRWVARLDVMRFLCGVARAGLSAEIRFTTRRNQEVVLFFVEGQFVYIKTSPQPLAFGAFLQRRGVIVSGAISRWNDRWFSEPEGIQGYLRTIAQLFAGTSLLRLLSEEVSGLSIGSSFQYMELPALCELPTLLSSSILHLRKRPREIAKLAGEIKGEYFVRTHERKAALLRAYEVPAIGELVAEMLTRERFCVEGGSDDILAVLLCFLDNAFALEHKRDVDPEIDSVISASAEMPEAPAFGNTDDIAQPLAEFERAVGERVHPRVIALGDAHPAFLLCPRLRAAYGWSCCCTPGQEHKGLYFLQQALADNPYAEQAHLYMARCRHFRGELPAAVFHYREVLELRPAAQDANDALWVLSQLAPPPKIEKKISGRVLVGAMSAAFIIVIAALLARFPLWAPMSSVAGTKGFSTGSAVWILGPPAAQKAAKMPRAVEGRVVENAIIYDEVTGKVSAIEVKGK